MTFRDSIQNVFDLHRAGQYEAARNVLIEVRHRASEDEVPSLDFYRICLDSITGRTDDALQLLEDTMASGWWYGEELLSDTDLDPIREHPRFLAVSSRFAALQTKARTAPCSPIVEDPVGRIRGTVVALHANGGRASHTARLWSPATALGYRVVAAESSQRVSSDRSSWDDLDRAVADVTSQLQDVDGRVILGGRSLGASLALHVAADTAVSAEGLILVAPSLRWDLSDPGKPTPTVILAGENDSSHLRQNAEDIAGFLHQHPVRHQVVSGMGHYYPEHFESLLTDSITWIERQA